MRKKATLSTPPAFIKIICIKDYEILSCGGEKVLDKFIETDILYSTMQLNEDGKISLMEIPGCTKWLISNDDFKKHFSEYIKENRENKINLLNEK